MATMINCLGCNGVGQILKMIGSSEQVQCPWCAGKKQVTLDKAVEIEKMITSFTTTGKTPAEAPSPSIVKAPQSVPMPVGDALVMAGKQMGKAFAGAATAELATTVVEASQTIARKALGEHWPAFLDTPAGQAALTVGLPTLILALAGMAPQSGVTMLLQQGATLALDGGAKNAVHDLRKFAEPILADIGDLTVQMLKARNQAALTSGTTGGLLSEATE